jgi:hypothetical protein
MSGCRQGLCFAFEESGRGFGGMQKQDPAGWILFFVATTKTWVQGLGAQ